MTTFYAHAGAYYTPISDSVPFSGRITRDPSPDSFPVGWWSGQPPEPKRGCTLRVVSYITTDTNCRLWRIVTANGQHVVTGITDKATAREVRAWLCPAPKE